MPSDYEAIASRALQDVGFRQIAGAPTSKKVFSRILRSHGLEDWLQTIGKLSREWANLRPGDPTFDLQLASALTAHRQGALSKIKNEGARFVSPSSLNTLAREALLQSPELPPHSWANGLGDFAWALIGTVDLFEDDLPPDPEVGIMSLLLRRIARPSPPLRSTLVRTHRLFIDLPQRFPELVAFDLAERSRQLAGIDLGRYVALCMTFYIRFDQAKTPDQWILSSDYYERTSVTADEFKRLVGTLASTPQAFRAAYKREFEQGFSGIDDHRPLVVTPLCEIRPGAFIPIDFPSLGDRLIGDGVFWRLRPVNEDEKTAYGATVGRLLERHLWEIARGVYPVSTQPQYERLFREHKFHGFDGPDVTVFDDEALMICEIGVSQVNVRETLHRGSLEAFDQDVKDVVLPRVQQLRKKIDAIRDNSFRYPGRTVDPLMRIEPVVCLLDGFPIAPLLRRRLDAAIDASGLLALPNVGRAAILSADEFELACATVEAGKASFTGLLADHAADPELSEWPFRDLVRKVTGEQPWTRLVQAQYDQAVTRVVREVAP